MGPGTSARDRARVEHISKSDFLAGAATERPSIASDVLVRATEAWLAALVSRELK